MRPTTFVIAFGPAAILFLLKTLIEPAWLLDYSFVACLGIGAAIGGFGAIAARVVEPRD